MVEKSFVDELLNWLSTWDRILTYCAFAENDSCVFLWPSEFRGREG